MKWTAYIIVEMAQKTLDGTYNYLNAIIAEREK